MALHASIRCTLSATNVAFPTKVALLVGYSHVDDCSLLLRQLLAEVGPCCLVSFHHHGVPLNNILNLRREYLQQKIVRIH